MDNFKFDITSDRDLEAILKLALKGAPGGKVVAYRVEQQEKEPTRLVLCWHESARDSIPLLAPVTVEGLFPLVIAWLDNHDYFKKTRGPDHDGDNGRGFRVYNESWGRVGGDSYAFAAVEPEWAWYGK